MRLLGLVEMPSMCYFLSKATSNNHVYNWAYLIEVGLPELGNVPVWCAPEVAGQVDGGAVGVPVSQAHRFIVPHLQIK